MSSQVLVSVIIPCYEHGRYLAEAISSVLEQTYSNTEIIVVDDGSREDPADPAVSQFVDSAVRLTFLKHPTRRGSAAARNLGVRQATGEFILPLDADDRLAPTYLERTVAALRDLHYGCVYTDMQLFGDQNYLYSPTISMVTALGGDPIPICTLYRRAVYEAVGGYREGLHIGEDTDFGIRALIKGYKYAYVPEPLYYYRKHGSSSSTQYVGGGSVQAIENVFAEHRDLFIENLPEILRLKEKRYCDLQQEYEHLHEEFQKLSKLVQEDVHIERGVRNNLKILIRSILRRCKANALLSKLAVWL